MVILKSPVVNRSKISILCYRRLALKLIYSLWRWIVRTVNKFLCNAYDSWYNCLFCRPQMIYPVRQHIKFATSAAWLPTAYEVRRKVIFILGNVCLSTWGVPPCFSMGAGGTPSFLKGGTPILPGGGYPSRLMRNTPIQTDCVGGVPLPGWDWMGVPPTGTGWGYPQLGLDGIPPQGTVTLGQVMPRSARLLRFPAGGLSCWRINFSIEVFYRQNLNLLNETRHENDTWCLQEILHCTLRMLTVMTGSWFSLNWIIDLIPTKRTCFMFLQIIRPMSSSA